MLRTWLAKRRAVPNRPYTLGIGPDPWQAERWAVFSLDEGEPRGCLWSDLSTKSEAEKVAHDLQEVPFFLPEELRDITISQTMAKPASYTTPRWLIGLADDELLKILVHHRQRNRVPIASGRTTLLSIIKVLSRLFLNPHFLGIIGLVLMLRFQESDFTFPQWKIPIIEEALEGRTTTGLQVARWLPFVLSGLMLRNAFARLRREQRARNEGEALLAWVAGEADPLDLEDSYDRVVIQRDSGWRYGDDRRSRHLLRDQLADAYAEFCTSESAPSWLPQNYADTEKVTFKTRLFALQQSVGRKSARPDGIALSPVKFLFDAEASRHQILALVGEGERGILSRRKLNRVMRRISQLLGFALHASYAVAILIAGKESSGWWLASAVVAYTIALVLDKLFGNGHSYVPLGLHREFEGVNVIGYRP